MDYKTFALGLAQEAGALIKKNFILRMKKDWKDGFSPVTETDRIVNQIVIDDIKKEFPGHGILAEERSDLSGEDEYIWVCDPVDGTKAFSHGIPTSVFSLALTHKGESLVGVVYDPFMDRMFFAEKGMGAFLNGEKISVSSNHTIGRSLFGVCSKWKNDPYDFSGLSEKIAEESGEIIDVGSIVYMGALVAVGELAATVFQGTKPWDTAALKILVEEAGGKVTDLFGNEQRYDQDIRGHLVSNGLLHDRLLEMLNATIKKPL